MHALDLWAKCVLECDQGALMLYNVKYDCRQGRPSKELIDAFLEKMTSDNPETTSPELSERAIERVTDARRDLLARGETPVKPDSGRCSHIMHGHDFLFRHFSEEARARLLIETTGDLAADQIESAIVSFTARGRESEIQNRRGFAWVTKSESLGFIDIEKARCDAAGTIPDLATTVRDLLGLIHYSKDTHLVEIRYPEGVVDTLDLAAPTFLEGGSGRVYRSNPQADGWGRTVSLQTWEAGVPEAVHKAIALEEGFEVTYLGTVACDRDTDYTKLFAHFDPDMLWSEDDSLEALWVTLR